MAALLFQTFGDFFDGHIRVMVYSYLHNLDPMTGTRPLEDDQPLGAVSSHRVILSCSLHVNTQKDTASNVGGNR
jgi:hypothetical protein